MWIEMWKEEVMASTPTDDLKQKFDNKQVTQGRLPPKCTAKFSADLEVGGPKV